MRSLYLLISLHFKTFFREPAVLFWALLFPIIIAWVLGIAFSHKGETVKTIYVTGDQPAPERLTGKKLYGKETGNSFRINFVKASGEDAVRAIKRGIIALYVEVKGDSVLYHFDPQNPEAQLTHLMLENGMPGANSANVSAMKPLSSVGTRYIDFLIPGLIALGIMNSCLWGISWNLIETRMKKLLRRMVATPMKKSFFLASHGITRIILGGIETGLLLTFAWFYFDTVITGSLLAFVIVFLSGIFAFSGIGILTASRTDKSEVGNGLINAVTLTMTILSGIFFNYHNFPEWVVPVIKALPLTMLADSIRAVFIEAAGIREIAIPVIVLSITGMVTFGLGLKIFKWY